jgi:hypothetical protein
MKKILVLVLVIMTGVAFAAAPAPAKTPAKAPAKTVQPPREVERDIPYAELGRFVGKRIIVHSALGTVRSGTLTHYTQSQIDIGLDGNGAQLSFARDAIKSVGVPIAPEETQSRDSAKKN